LQQINLLSERKTAETTENGGMKIPHPAFFSGLGNNFRPSYQFKSITYLCKKGYFFYINMLKNSEEHSKSGVAKTTPL
jgi:hypothetical protein